jgi:hypothetical protein
LWLRRSCPLLQDDLRSFIMQLWYQAVYFPQKNPNSFIVRVF